MIDEEVEKVLSMASLAHRLGVKPPSLYKNVDGMSGIHRGIMLRAKADLAQVLGQAAIGGRDPDLGPHDP